MTCGSTAPKRAKSAPYFIEIRENGKADFAGTPMKASFVQYIGFAHVLVGRPFAVPCLHAACVEGKIACQLTGSFTCRIAVRFLLRFAWLYFLIHPQNRAPASTLHTVDPSQPPWLAQYCKSVSSLSVHGDPDLPFLRAAGISESSV